MNSGIHEIIITIASNIPEKPTFELTSDVYYISDKKDEFKYNKYPFFTVNMRFPKSLHKYTRQQLKEIFFNKDNFEREITTGEYAKTDKEQQDNATYNMKVLLQLLMPTSFPSVNNYHVSFDENILNTTASFEESKSWVSYFVGSKPRYSYVKIGESIYSFIDVTWVNDIVNLSEYRQLFRKLHQYSTNDTGDSSTNISTNETRMEELKQKIKTEYGGADGFYTNLHKNSTRKIKDGTSKTILEEIIKTNDTASARRQVGVPPDEMNPLLEDFEVLNDTNIDTIMKIFFKLVKLELDAKKASSSSNFIPQQLESLKNFRTLMNSVKKYYYLIELNTALGNLGEFMKIVNKKTDDMSNQWEVYLQSQFKNIKEVVSIVDMMKKYRKPIPSEKNKLTTYQYVTNTSLQSLINDFGQGTKGNELTVISKEVVDILLSKPKDDVQLENPNVFSVGVITRVQPVKPSDDKDTKKEEDVFGINRHVTYHVELQADFVKGQLTKDTIKNIKCPYTNDMLIQQYYNLKNPRKNLYLLHKNKPLIDIDTMKKNTKSSTQTRKRAKTIGGFNPSASKSASENKSPSINKKTRKRRARKLRKKKQE